VTAGPGPLLDLLDARSGIVCAVGAGGKKSVLVRLASQHPRRVAITATVFTTYVQEQIGFVAVVEEAARLPGRVAAVDAAASVAYACPATQPARRAGVPAAIIERIHREGGFAATYVKADGARMRLIKSPAEDEPVLPATCSTVIVVVSARAIGEALTPRIAHRLPRISEVLGLAEGDTLTAAHVGQLMASPDGLLKATEGRSVVPVINMVDDPGRERLAREAAEAALAGTARFDRVVLTRLSGAGDPVVAVVRRR
jgi:probable selenium-dependent hydroxylase accessory protein YqeC